MRRTSRITLWLLLCAAVIAPHCGGPPPVLEKPVSKAPEWYFSRYPFMDEWGKVFTFESEFDWPTGFVRPDSASLSPYSFWVSHFPLYHKNREVGSFRHGVVFEANEISRTVDMNWRTNKFRDDIIPIQMLGEYYLHLGRSEDLAIEPKLGQTMIYGRWLSGKVTYGPRRNLQFTPSPKRANSDDEFSKFFDLCANNTTFNSLRDNCLPVDDAEVIPGDIFIVSNQGGGKGKIYVVLCMLESKRHEKVYAVGTGCSNACDFHIPLVGQSRSDPWLTTDGIRGLTPELPNRGFFRLINSDLSRL